MSNSFRKCQMCGDIYTFMGKDICPKCVKKMDEDFVTVRKYLYENPRAGVEEVSKETEVDEKVIIHFLREGRLELKTADGSGGLVCEKCGKPLTKGRICEECIKNLTSTLGGAVKQPVPQQKKSGLDGAKKESKLHVNVFNK